MKSGICPKCGENEVYGDGNKPHGISVNWMAISWVNTILLVCASCGYIEFYVENEEDLANIRTVSYTHLTLPTTPYV